MSPVTGDSGEDRTDERRVPYGARVGPTTRLECKVCWYVYDPAHGDDVWQVPAGTPFYALPEHWTCPQCGGERSQFLVMPDA